MVHQLIMNTAIEKIRAKRRSEIKIGSITFQVIRASMEQALLYHNDKLTVARICQNHVTGWSGVTMADLVDDGGKEIVPFDKELFAEVIADRIDWWEELYKDIIADAEKRAKERESSAKK